MKQISFLTILMISLMNCGHKAAPLVRDRLKPKLLRVNILNRSQIQLAFSEPVDTMQIHPDSFMITSAAETLNILAIYPTLSAAEIMLATEPAQKTEYQIVGHVFDTAMNRGNFTKKFIGTDFPDTIKPWISGYPRGPGVKSIDLVFSEAVDTVQAGFRLLPKLDYRVNWRDRRRCSLDPAEADQWLQDSATYYLFSTGQIFDLNHNPLVDFLTVFTPDAVYQPLFLQGRALVGDALVDGGIAVISRDKAIGIAVVSQGVFKFEVRDSLPYRVTVIADQYSGSGDIVIGAENRIELEVRKVDLEDIID